MLQKIHFHEINRTYCIDKDLCPGGLWAGSSWARPDKNTRCPESRNSVDRRRCPLAYRDRLEFQFFRWGRDIEEEEFDKGPCPRREWYRRRFGPSEGKTSLRKMHYFLFKFRTIEPKINFANFKVMAAINEKLLTKFNGKKVENYLRRLESSCTVRRTNMAGDRVRSIDLSFRNPSCPYGPYKSLILRWAYRSSEKINESKWSTRLSK